MSDTIAGRYTLVDPIARGGSGTVWRAWDQRRRSLCAAKVLRQRDSADLLRFVREQSVKLEHPHVLAPYGWAAEDEHVVIAMDLCDGGTLETVLQDHGALADDVVEEIMLQLLRALHFVHAEGWIHRDVKPANLMMNATGTGRPVARLADFGIATQVEDARLTRIGTVVGTPGYIAPELMEGADPNPAQDLFAAGVVAMRMVLPYEGRGQSPTPEMALEAFGEDSLLGAEVAALLDPDPSVRTDGALALQERLAAESEQRHFSPAHTRDGEPLEVFQTLEPLPGEWQEVVDGTQPAPQQPTTGAVTAARSGEAGQGSGGSATQPSNQQMPGGDRGGGASGWIRTNYGIVTTPTPGGEPLVGPTSGPAGSPLNGMPSGLTGDGGLAPTAPPLTSGSTTGSVVQGPLPQGQDSRATLIGAPSTGRARPARRDLSHLTVEDTTAGTGQAGQGRPGTFATTGSAGGASLSGAAVGERAHDRAGFAPTSSTVTKGGPLRRFGIRGTAGWLVIGVVALLVTIGLVFGLLALTNNQSDPAPDPSPTSTPADTATPTSTATSNGTGGSGAGNNPEPTIGSGFGGEGPGRIGD